MRIRTVIAASVLGMLACAGEPSEAPPSTDVDEPRDRVTIVRLAIDVDEIDAAAGRVRRLIARHEGYVESATTSERASLVARVPVAHLDTVRGELRELGEVRLEQEEVEDVTRARVDQGIRLRNARREEERLLGLMSERTASLADVIAIEERLGVVRERIEQLEAAERALAQRIEMAEIHVDLSPRSVPFWRDPVATLARAGAWGLEAAAAVLVGIAALAAGAGPTVALFALALALLVVSVRGLRRLRLRA